MPLRKVGPTEWLAFLLLLCAGAEAARADENWKDGCPAFFAPESVPTSISELPTHTGVSSFGALPEIDSPLGPSRVVLSSWTGQLTQETPAAVEPNLVGGEGLIHLAAAAGPFLTVALSGVNDRDPDSRLSRLGNLQPFIGYRRAKYLLGTAFRAGWAIRLGGGGAPHADSSPNSSAQRGEIATLSPFREAQFAFESPISIALEMRVEMIGCHAPFVDLRVDGAEWQPSDVNGKYPRQYVLPIALAIGGYFLPRNALYAEFAWEHRWELLYSHITRVSLGWEGRYQHLHVGVRLAAITGHDISGWEASTTVGWQFGWTGTLE